MKIAIVMPCALPIPSVLGGATETLVQKIIDDNEIKHKFDITVYSVYNKNAQKESEKYNYTRFFYVDESKRLYKLKYLFFRFRRKLINSDTSDVYIKKILNDIRKKKFDCVIVESSISYTDKLLKYAKTDVYLHLHFDGIKLMSEELMKNITGVLSVSEFIQNKIIEKFPQYSKKVLLYRNAIDTEKFSRSEEKAIPIKKKLNISDNDTVILYSGRIMRVKGVHRLLEAFMQLYKVNKNVKLIIAGSAEYGATVKDEYYDYVYKMSQPLLNKNIFFLGYIPHKEMISYYSAADIAATPTYEVDEANSLAVLEAMASSCIIVASDSGNNINAIEKNAGFVIMRDEKFEENMANILIKLCADIKAFDYMKKNARENMVRDYNAKSYYDALLPLIKKSEKGKL